MPRKLRVEYPGAIYHIMSRGDRREEIYLNDTDRQHFLKTLGEACEKTDWLVHAYCLMSNHYHLVVETPNANLVAGMTWLQSTYTIRFNHRHKLIGHVLSGRYKAQLIDGSGNSYLRTACDYVHLNPERANLISQAESLTSYRWSSFPYYLVPRAHRPKWLRVDRLMGEHGFQQDTSATREQFKKLIEARRLEGADAAAIDAFRRGWFIGSDAFKKEMLEQMESKLGEHHSGQMRRETAEAKAERIISEELRRLGWNGADLVSAQKTHPAKLSIGVRLRRETTLSVKVIAQLAHLGTWKSANARLHAAMQAGIPSTSSQTELGLNEGSNHSMDR